VDDWCSSLDLLNTISLSIIFPSSTHNFLLSFISIEIHFICCCLLLFFCCWSYWRRCHVMTLSEKKESERNAVKLKFTRIYVKRIEWWGRRSCKIEGFFHVVLPLIRPAWMTCGFMVFTFMILFFYMWEKFLVMRIVGHVTDYLIYSCFSFVGFLVLVVELIGDKRLRQWLCRM
jgi:hypothetical protein